MAINATKLEPYLCGRLAHGAPTQVFFHSCISAGEVNRHHHGWRLGRSQPIGVRVAVRPVALVIHRIIAYEEGHRVEPRETRACGACEDIERSSR